MASPALIQRTGEALAEAAASSAKVILFGPHARGEAQSDSTGGCDRRGEERVREWGELPRTMLHDALTQGRVLAGAGS